MTRRVAVTSLLTLVAAVVLAADAPPTYDGLSAAERALFDAGRAQFETSETPATGLGPVFNADSCAACHAEPASGGSSAITVTRFGRGDGGFDPMTEFGGPVVQAKGITRPECSVAGEVV